MRFQHAQQRDLNVLARTCDFVEKQRTAVCLFEPAVLVVRGAGKRAAPVSKQFGIQQIAVEHTRVDRDERTASHADFSDESLRQ
jgi:hypothetical protein